MTNGWVKIHRKLLEHEMWASSEAVTMWLYCLLKATHTTCQAVVGTKVIPLKPGQFVFGRVRTHEQTGLSEWTIRKGIHTLELLNCITKEPFSTRRGSLITVVNWATYQLSPGNLTDGAPTEHHEATDQTHCTRSKEEKKKKKTTGCAEIPLILFTDKFKAAWARWLQYRKELRKPLTPSTQTIHLEKLAPVGVEEAILRIDNAIERSWQVPFEFEDRKKKSTETPSERLARLEQENGHG